MTGIDEDAARRLLTEVVAAARDTTLQHTLGSLLSVDGNGTVTVALGGSGVGISGVKILNSWKPQPGDNVAIVRNGADLFAIGSFTPRGATGPTVEAMLYRGPITAVTDGGPLGLSVSVTLPGVFDVPDVRFLSWAVPEVGDEALVLVGDDGNGGANTIAFPAVIPPPAGGGDMADPTEP